MFSPGHILVPNLKHPSKADLIGKVQTIRNLMSKGIFRLGKHYFKPNGGHPLFKRSAIIAWIEGETT